PGRAVLCGDDPRVRGWGAVSPRRAVYYGRSGPVPPRAPGVWVMPDGRVRAQGLPGAEGVDLFRRQDLRLRGCFHLVHPAGGCALLLGATPRGVLEGVRGFRPVPHRLELVHVEAGVEFFNDSIATTPESAICALEALGPRVILIAGGYDKGSSFGELGRTI